MIYSNIYDISRQYQVSFGTINAIALGEHEPNGFRVLIPTGRKIMLEIGENPTLTLGTGRRGKPCIRKCGIDHKEPADTYIFLVSSQSGLLAHGNGRIMVSRNTSAQIKILQQGYGCDEFGHRWEAAYLLIQGDAMIRVIPSGHEHGLDDTLYWFSNSKMKIIHEMDLIRMNLMELAQLPFHYVDHCFDESEWVNYLDIDQEENLCMT